MSSTEEIALTHIGGADADDDAVSELHPSLQSTSTVEQVFKDFKGRREGLLNALTCDVDELFRQFKSQTVENLSLFGLPDGSWTVRIAEPAQKQQQLSALLSRPQPVVGINCARNETLNYDWLQTAAVHSDVWLLSSAFFDGSGFTKQQRRRLFNLMNKVQTLQQAVCMTKIGNRTGSRERRQRRDSGESRYTSRGQTNIHIHKCEMSTSSKKKKLM